MISHVLPPCRAGREERPAATGDFLSAPRRSIGRGTVYYPPHRSDLFSHPNMSRIPILQRGQPITRSDAGRSKGIGTSFKAENPMQRSAISAEARSSINPWSPPSTVQTESWAPPPTLAVLNPGWTATSPNRTVVSWFPSQPGASNHRMIAISALSKSKCAVLQQRSTKLSCWLDRLPRVCAVKLHRAIPMCSCEMCGGGRLAARPLDVGGRVSSHRLEGLRELLQHVRRLIACMVVLGGSSHATAVSYWLS